ncbi:histidine kinase dimerization/phospho-acceptor domain-containing protein [Cerasicoccus fimbriatus]|uniref:histidine kinase dimerization/phospho-acceptor domain-containing protein n=1 Tax=Cerasicoccus fimbriatus TaxID=3014554 RepID=UPI0022B34D00|nr:histidine kinase dimerization/phospho-acceptor domain-containing protein [Cerasicoccus sp. TK19100]
MNLSDNEENSFRSLVHDLNGQIFLIRGHCEILKRTQDESQTEKSIQQIQQGTDRLESIVRDLRENLGFPKAP